MALRGSMNNGFTKERGATVERPDHGSASGFSTQSIIPLLGSDRAQGF